MANISHATLTGAELHEPKGVENAELGEVYVANGTGSGNWANVGTSSFTGMIADFTWPVVQNGWLECDGSDINTTTYSALYSVMTIQMNGTRVNGSNTITSLTSTSNMRVGYYVFGTGISSGTTITSINSATQITISTNAVSSGTSNVVVSPWLLNTGTIRLPDTSARFRRSRYSVSRVGEIQTDSFASHSHTGGGNTGVASADHSHAVIGNTGAMNSNAVHTHTSPIIQTTVLKTDSLGTFAHVLQPIGAAGGSGAGTIENVSTVNTDHTHGINLNTSGMSATHSHAFSLTTDATGTSETRPLSIVTMTCVKT